METWWIFGFFGSVSWIFPRIFRCSCVGFKMSWDFHGFSERFVMKHGLEHAIFVECSQLQVDWGNLLNICVGKLS